MCFYFFLQILAKLDISYNPTCWVHPIVSYQDGSKNVHGCMRACAIVLYLGLENELLELPLLKALGRKETGGWLS